MVVKTLRLGRGVVCKSFIGPDAPEMDVYATSTTKAPTEDDRFASRKAAEKRIRELLEADPGRAVTFTVGKQTVYSCYKERR